MTRRSGAAKALVEQPRRACPGHRVRRPLWSVRSPRTLSKRSGLPHCPVPVERVTSTTGRSPSRTAARRAAVTVAVSNAALRCSSDPDLADGAYRLIHGRYVAGPERVDVQRAADSVLPSRALTSIGPCTDGESGSSRSVWSQSSSAPGAYVEVRSRPETVALPDRLQSAYQKSSKEVRGGVGSGPGCS